MQTHVDPSQKAGLLFRLAGGNARQTSINARKSVAWLSNYLTGFHRMNNRAYAEVLVALDGDVSKADEIRDAALEAYEARRQAS